MSLPFYATRWRTAPTPEVKETVEVAPETKPTVDVCEKCGFEWNSNQVGGTWPFCKGQQSDHILDHSFGFDAFEPYTEEHLPGGTNIGVNYSGEKVLGHFIDSRSTRNRIMKENNIVSGGRVKHREKHSNEINYDKVAERIATSAYSEWKGRR